MQHTVELLVRGDPHVGDYYRRAGERWKEIWSRPESGEVIQLATLLSDEQAWFEQHCGGQWVGPEVMVLSGLGMLFDTGAGFDGNAERARRLYDAFQLSYCSLEAKGVARDAAASYGLLQVLLA